MTFRVAGAVPQQFRAQSGHYRTLSVVPVEFDSVRSQGESGIIPVDAGRHHQGTSTAVGHRINCVDRIPLRRVSLLI